MRRFFRIYLLPGFVFQSLVIGGGYGTGRELVEFFLGASPAGGLLGMLVATVIWSAVLAVTFELARMGSSYDYRSFVGGLLGRGWIAYEVVYLISLVLVLSVLGSAAGKMLTAMTGLPELVGIAAMIAAVGVLAFHGSNLIERFMSMWSIALYAVYLAVAIGAFVLFREAIGAALTGPGDPGNWVLSGSKYAAYNVGIAPAMLFCIRHLSTRREAIGAGLIAGVLGILPGVLLFIAMLGQYPAIVSEAVPSDFLLAAMNSEPLRLIFQMVLFGTFVETGVGEIHGFNERVAGVLQEKGLALRGRTRVWIAVALLVTSLFLADAVGLVDLIASGYGTLTWGFWLVFVIPVLTLGTYRVLKGASQKS